MKGKGFNVNILVVGDLATGKSTLVNTILKTELDFYNIRHCHTSSRPNVNIYVESLSYDDNQDSFWCHKFEDPLFIINAKQSGLVPRTGTLHF